LNRLLLVVVLFYSTTACIQAGAVYDEQQSTIIAGSYWRIFSEFLFLLAVMAISKLTPPLARRVGAFVPLSSNTHRSLQVADG